jgi:hypothetical protein
VTRRRCVLDQYLADPLHVRTWVRAWRGTDVQEDHHRCVASMHIRYSTDHKLKLLMLAEETRSDASSSIHLQSRRTAARSRRGESVLVQQYALAKLLWVRPHPQIFWNAVLITYFLLLMHLLNQIIGTLS